MTTEVRTSPARRRPAPDQPVPTSTYRLQLSAAFTFDDAAARVGYLAGLGVTHLYLSPILRAAPGSTHGYDVVDHREISPALGGRPAFDRLVRAAHDAGLGIVVDIVPNHMAVPTPLWHNRALWSVAAQGPRSPYASWFDVDWTAGDGALLMPVLGSRIGTALAAGELELDTVEIPGMDGPQTVLRYGEHVFPVRPGTEHLPLAELVERQHYRLAYWRVANEELNYRRFFDVGTLAAIRVEDPEVFGATHALLVDLARDGAIDGLRIDHPDGLADPRAYLDHLAEATGDAWVVVEKILTATEQLPDDWATAGTTGYDVAWRVNQVFVDPGGEAELGAVMHRLTGDTPDALPRLVAEAKREIITGPLYAEVERLADLAADICRDDVRLRDHTRRSLHDCLVEMLVAADRYRYYVVPGEPTTAEVDAAFAECVARARARLEGDRLETLDLLADLLSGHETGSAGRRREPRRDELVVRFQQTCGAVMAKGVEDTAYYRWTHLVALTEVGGAPERFAISLDELHSWAGRAQHRAPVAMTVLSTHDTKRSEDVRARLGVLSELPVEWSALVERLRAATAAVRGSLVDGRTENLLWQTLAGTWTADGPLPEERLLDYLTKAMREAKSHTGWTAVDEPYEAAVLDLARAALTDATVADEMTGWVRATAPGVRAATLGTKLVQLTLPGVADVYQGTESTLVALVDPDNRRPVDFDRLAARLRRLETEAPRNLADEKLLLTSRALRLRRERPQAFVGPGAGYQAVPTSTGNALAFARTVGGDPVVVTVATRLALALERLGGWGEHTVVLPDGAWRDALTGRTLAGGTVRLAELLRSLPVALLVRAEPAAQAW
ncbi:MAG TPA: malto-oligosyltrehalose synthase [Cellulomonas sp.]